MFLSKRKNGVYYLFYTNSENKRACISTQSKVKSKALDFQHEFYNDLKQKKIRGVIEITLEQYCFNFLKYSESIHSEKTTSVFKTTFRYVKNYFGDIELNSLTKKMMLQYFDNRLRTSSIYHARKDLINMSSAFTRAVEENYLIDNPCTGIKRYKIPEKQPLFFTGEEVNHLLSVIEDEDIKDIVLFAINTGLRQMELITLDWSQVNVEKQLLTLDNRNTFTKSKRVRSVPLNSNAMKIIIRRKLLNQSLVFTIDKSKISQDAISHRFNKYVKKAKLRKGYCFHTLRHSFASNLIQNGVSIYFVSKLLGHADIKTTEIYAHLRNDDLRKATEMISL